MSQDKPTFQVLVSWQHRYRLRYRHPVPGRPGEGDPTLLGPYEVRGHALYWRWSAADDDWEVVTPVDISLADYTAKRGKVCHLADEHRGSMPPEELIQMLVLACIETGIDTKPDIMDAVTFANAHIEGYDDDDVKRVIDEGRGNDRTKHLWRRDERGRYHAYG